MNIKRLFILLMIVFSLTGVAQARVSALTVAVDGMACPFCAFGVEKRLKTVKGVKSVTVDMKSGSAKLIAMPTETISYQDVPGAVKDAGFTAGDMEITASGIIEKGKYGGFLLRFDGLSLPLATADSGLTARLLDAAASGKSIELQGAVDNKKMDGWSLLPKIINEVTP